jgi:hypothetical protein
LEREASRVDGATAVYNDVVADLLHREDKGCFGWRGEPGGESQRGSADSAHPR